jgi:luciferase family oxidoreductase group 1
MTAPLSLGVLDQSPIPSGSTAAEALANTVDLARHAERLGYSRYWLAEHHNTLGLAGPAPEVMVATVAAATETIRVGAGGVMLPHYSSLKVAETFRVLEALHPGRIDLGIGRAPGGDPLSAAALRIPTPEGDRFPNQVQDLIGYLEDRLDPRHPFARVRATPEPPGAPPVWMLGSSDYGAAVASVLGTAFSFAHFINPAPGPMVVADYRERFQPSPSLPEPRASVGVNVICADTSEEALRLAASVRLWRRRLMRGDPGPFPSVEEALEELGERANEPPHDPDRRLVFGDPGTVCDQLSALADRYGVDELIVLTICHDHAARVRSYELLAGALALVDTAATVTRRGGGSV